MASFFKIPVSTGPQKFISQLGGVDYQITLTYANTNEGGWVMDIADTTGVPIVCGIPLVTGIDLLGQYKSLGIAGRIWVQTASNPDAVPTYSNLGGDASIYWVTD